MCALDGLIKYQTDRGLDKRKYSWHTESANILEEMFEANGYDIPKQERPWLLDTVKFLRTKASTNPLISWKPATKDMMVDAFADIIVFAVGAILKLGYDPKKVLVEVGKEINSREGEIINGKFEKYLDDEHVAKWYKANYKSCCIKESNNA